MASKGFYQQGPEELSWETPPALFDALWKKFDGFDFDPCCRVGQYTARRVLDNHGTICIPPTKSSGSYTTPRTRVFSDGLAQAWWGKVFMNPPYARGEIIKWVSWAYAQVAHGQADLVCALLPVRTDTRWWQSFICGGAGEAGIVQGFEALGKASDIHFLPKRQTFVGANNQARFASCIVIWGKVA